MAEKDQASIKKIVLAIDKSGYKDKAVDYAILLSNAIGCEVTAIHVIGRSSLGATGDLLGYYRGGRIGAYQQALKKDAEQFLARVAEKARKQGVEFKTEVLIKSPVKAAIIDYAKKYKADMIIIGTKGMTGLEKFLIGSVANDVVTYAHCPVLAIR